MRIVVGQFRLDKEDKEEMIFDIEDVHKHEKWNNEKDRSDFKHDIALVRIRRKGDGSGINLSSKSGLVRPACLPPKDSSTNEDGKLCTVAGWGITKSGGEASNCLRSAKVPIMPNKKCQSIFDKSDNTKQISGGRCN